MKSLIYVNRHKVRDNKKNGTDEPCIAIKTYKGVEYTKHATFGDWGIKQDFKNPICSGATIWIYGPREGITIIED